MIEMLVNLENEAVSLSEKISSTFVKNELGILSNTDICSHNFSITSKSLPFNFTEDCPKLLKGRLKAGLYPTEIELLNNYRVMVDNVNVGKKGLVKGLLSSNETIESKKALLILNTVLRQSRYKILKDLLSSFHRYIIHNLYLIVFYTFVISLLIYLDHHFVYSIEQSRLIKIRKILLFIPSKIVNQNPHTRHL